MQPGHTLAILIPPAARPAHIAGFHRAMETGHLDTAGAPVRVTATHADGSLVEVEMTPGLHYDAPQKPTAAIAALRPAGPRRPLSA